MSETPSVSSRPESFLGEQPEIPAQYFPKQVGPGHWDPLVFRSYAEMCQRGLVHEFPIKSWLALWMVDCFEALERIANGDFGIGTAAQKYAQDVLDAE